MLNDEKRTERKRVQYQARSGFAVPPPRQRNIAKRSHHSSPSTHENKGCYSESYGFEAAKSPPSVPVPGAENETHELSLLVGKREAGSVGVLRLRVCGGFC